MNAFKIHGIMEQYTNALKLALKAEGVHHVGESKAITDKVISFEIILRHQEENAPTKE